MSSVSSSCSRSLRRVVVGSVHRLRHRRRGLTGACWPSGARFLSNTKPPAADSAGFGRQQKSSTQSEYQKQMMSSQYRTTTLVPENEIFVADSDNMTATQTVLTGRSDQGFEINNIGCYGAVVLLPNYFALFDATRLEDVTFEKLELITLYTPNIDLLLIGTGEVSRQVDPALLRRLRECGIRFEVMNSRAAAGTYNFLNGEGRDAAAILLPELPVSARDDPAPDQE